MVPADVDLLPQVASIDGWVNRNLGTINDQIRMLAAAQCLQMDALEECILAMEHTWKDIARIRRRTSFPQEPLYGRAFQVIVHTRPAYRTLAGCANTDLQKAILRQVWLLLINRDGDIDLVNNGRWAASENVLTWAVRSTTMVAPLVELLMYIPGIVADLPEDVDDGSALTPLQWAALRGLHRSVDLLLQIPGIKVDAGAGAAGTALHHAAGFQSYGITESLIRHGANLNAVDRCGWTPLHVAAARTRLSVIRLLVRNGANANVPNNERRTPLHLAARSGDRDAAQFLMRSDTVDLTLRDVDGKTPWDYMSGWWSIPGTTTLSGI